MEQCVAALSMIGKLATLTFPMVCSAGIWEVASLANLFFVGRLNGAKYIGAATLGSMMCNITGYSVMYGMCTALDSMLSQAYGAKAYTLVGLYAQRAIVIFTVGSLPVIAIWSQTDKALEVLLGIDQETSQLACVWSNILALGLWPTLVYEAFKRWLQCQNVVWPVTVSSAAGAMVLVVWDYYTQNVMTPSLGFEGVALGFVAMQWANLIILVVLIVGRKWWIRYFNHSSSSNDNKDGKDGSQHSNGKSSLTKRIKKLANTMSGVAANNSSQSSNGDKSGGSYSKLNMNDKDEAASSLFTLEDDDEDDNGEGGVDSNVKDVLDAKMNASVSVGVVHNGGVSRVQDPEDNFPEISLQVFQEWLQFLKLGIPGAASLFIEWGSFELAAGIAGQLGTVPLAVHGIYSSTAALFYQVPMAVANATAILAGNYVGARETKDAQAVVTLGLIISFVYGSLAGAVLLLVCRPYWGKIFSDDAEVQALVYDTLPIMFVYTVVDSSKCIALNVLRSTGRPTITFFVNIFVCVCVMLPVGYYWGVVCGYSLMGLWGGMSLAWLVATVCFSVIVIRTDWSDPKLILDENINNNNYSNSSDKKVVRVLGVEGDIELATKTSQ